MVTTGRGQSPFRWLVDDLCEVAVHNDNPERINAKLILDCFNTDKPCVELTSRWCTRKLYVQFPVQPYSTTVSTEILKENFTKFMKDYVTKENNFIAVAIENVKYWFKGKLCEAILEEFLQWKEKGRHKFHVKLSFCALERHNFDEAVKSCRKVIGGAQSKSGKNRESASGMRSSSNSVSASSIGGRSGKMQVRSSEFKMNDPCAHPVQIKMSETTPDQSYQLKKVGKYWLIGTACNKFRRCPILTNAKEVDLSDNFLIADDIIYEIQEDEAGEVILVKVDDTPVLYKQTFRDKIKHEDKCVIFNKAERGNINIRNEKRESAPGQSFSASDQCIEAITKDINAYKASKLCELEMGQTEDDDHFVDAGHTDETSLIERYSWKK